MERDVWTGGWGSESEALGAVDEGDGGGQGRSMSGGKRMAVTDGGEQHTLQALDRVAVAPRHIRRSPHRERG
jgi:hypothetical protein